MNTQIAIHPFVGPPIKTYVEIYMEKIRDLLDPYKTKVNLQIREDPAKVCVLGRLASPCLILGPLGYLRGRCDGRVRDQ